MALSPCALVGTAAPRMSAIASDTAAKSFRISPPLRGSLSVKTSPDRPQQCGSDRHAPGGATAMPARDPWQTRPKYASFLRPPRVRLCVFVRCVRSHAAVAHDEIRIGFESRTFTLALTHTGRRSIGPSTGEILKSGGTGTSLRKASHIDVRAEILGSHSRNQETHAASARSASSLPTSSTTFSTSFMITSFSYFGESIPLTISIASP